MQHIFRVFLGPFKRPSSLKMAIVGKEKSLCDEKMSFRFEIASSIKAARKKLCIAERNHLVSLRAPTPPHLQSHHFRAYPENNNNKNRNRIHLERGKGSIDMGAFPLPLTDSRKRPTDEGEGTLTIPSSIFPLTYLIFSIVFYRALHSLLFSV